MADGWIRRLVGGGAVALGVAAAAVALASAPATAGESLPAAVDGVTSVPAPVLPTVPAPSQVEGPALVEAPHGHKAHAPGEEAPPVAIASTVSAAAAEGGGAPFGPLPEPLFARTPTSPSEPRRSIPPSLSADALRAELARGQAERERLEKLTADLAAAREAVRKETERLQKLIEANHAAAKAAAPSSAPAVDQPGEGGDSALEQEASALAGELEKADPRAPDPSRLASLARALRAMKPQQAAVVVSRVNDELASRILIAMKPADAGPIIARLAPERAGQLMEKMARIPLEQKR